MPASDALKTIIAHCRISARSLLFLLVMGLHPGSAQEVTSVKLFDATATFATGPETTPAAAVTFSPTKTLILNFAEGDVAVISSTPDGKGPIVIDNFMTINDVDVCQGVTTFEPVSCVGGFLRNPQDPSVIGAPIETVLQPIAPIDVSRFIPIGQGLAAFELRDFGVIAGNTDLFLVTNANVNLSTRLTPSPAALKQAFDEAIGVCRDSVTTSARAIFNDAFTQQIAQPILKGLKSARPKPEVIDQIRNQLNTARQDLGDEISDGIDASLRNLGVGVAPLFRNSEIVRQMTGLAASVTALNPDVGVPQVSTDQPIADILAQGFDPGSLAISWSDITGVCSFGQDGASQSISATINPTLAMTKTCSGDNCITDFSMAAKLSFAQAIEGGNRTYEEDVDCPDPAKKSTTPRPTPQNPRPQPITISWGCNGKVGAPAPDLSRIGLIVVIALIVFIALWRKQPGTVASVYFRGPGR